MSSSSADGSWKSRFVVQGVFWRQFLHWAVLNIPYWIEPIVIAFWTTFFLLWGPGRRGVMANLSVILPGSSDVGNFFRTWRVFWNFAWVITDTVRFKELRVIPDWEMEGLEHFRELQEQHSAIILTAHMGSYDLGAQLFAEITNRSMFMVRAPETDPRTRRFEESLDERTRVDGLTVGFSTRSQDLAIDLLHALQEGEIIAIQGDRITPGISALDATLFGKPTSLPAGPFALAMASHTRVYPLFIVRLGRRRYRLIVRPAFEVARTRNRDESFARATTQWTTHLEDVLRRAWYQWFAFERFWRETA
jgi:lauroyl/myristoyl acyltransferase